MKPAVITVSFLPRDPKQYEITILQSNGRKISGLPGGYADEAAARAAMYAIEHCLRWGGFIVAPDEVSKRIPPSLLRMLPRVLEYSMP